MATDSSSSRLGRGLGSMFDEVSGIKAGSRPTTNGFMRIPLTDIRANIYKRTADHNLCESVKKLGILQPILVAQEGSHYKLLAGSRRLEAASKAGLADIPAIVVPPDRAGALDVFLEENLSRAELNKDERSALRDQWIKETGRDEEQAARRIPASPNIKVQENRNAAPGKTGNVWRMATITSALVCLVLIIILVKPEKVVESNAMDVAVESVLAEQAAETANRNNWMEQFPFPGTTRTVEDDRLVISPSGNLFSAEGELTRNGMVFFYRLAAIVMAAPDNIHIEITTHGGTDYTDNLSRAAQAVSILRDEGVPPARLSIKAADDTTEEVVSVSLSSH